MYDSVAMIGTNDLGLASALLLLCRKGMDLYFKRHDGQAVTCDDFLAAMADANGQDLSSVARWSAPLAHVSDGFHTTLYPSHHGCLEGSVSAPGTGT